MVWCTYNAIWLFVVVVVCCFFNVRVSYAIYVKVLVCSEMIVCGYFVCWVEFDELYFSYSLKNA